MKEIKGTALSKVLLDEKDQEKRKALFAQWKPKVAEAAADIAEKKGILHGDLNMNNVIVDGDKVNLIDWEHYSKKGDKDFTSDKAKIQSHLDMVWDSDVKSSQLCGRDALFCPLPPRRPKAKAPTSDATKSTTSTLEKPALLKQKDSKAPVTSKTPNASLRKAPVPKSSPLLKSASTKTQTSVRKSAKLGQKLGMSKFQESFGSAKVHRRLF
ncbi:hypothetical protein CPB83DRAFT_254800 [Crepidotus variabilis]|uniref:Aminoglycoside phosphotransferase domain-containing protein n=1 Tax=Crepidotus variabilis TaxID=179855 RepID=A0A9P6EJI1_9AGAR|nr:hypothetical protein CPB83DRAFT_254800 [Crepidotus variabilis]